VAQDGTKIRLGQFDKENVIETLSSPPRHVQTASDQTQLENPNAVFVHKLRQEFDLSSAVSHQILQAAKEVLFGQAGGQLGQVGVVVARLDAPTNAPLTYTDRVEVTLTIDAGVQDTEVEVEEGVAGLRRGRVLRLQEEALEQGGVLTQEDLAWILNVNVRTIRRDIQILKEEGHSIYTRGQLNADEPIRLYKVQAIERWLDQTDISQIAHWLHHSPQAVKQYVEVFLRTVILRRQEKSSQEIASLVKISVRLVDGYLTVYEAVLDKPVWQTKVEQEIAQLEELSNG
jgi:hypothetical protein